MLRQTVILLVGAVLLVNGHPSGAPDSVCNFGGSPGHDADEQIKRENPYNVEASSSSYSPGSEIQLKISGEEFFRGYFFQAFDKDSGDIIGTWLTNSESRLVAPCSGITHTNNADKYSVTLTWKYTGDQSGNLYFKGAIVQTYSVYWTNIVAAVH